MNNLILFKKAAAGFCLAATVFISLFPAEDVHAAETGRIPGLYTADEEAGPESEKPFVLSEVVCWGDSLTKGDKGDGVTYPDVLASLLPEDVYVVNASTAAGGENSITVTCRTGARHFVLDQEYIFPDPGTESAITFCADTGQWVNPLRRHPDRAWRVSIDGVTGILKLTEDTPPDLKYAFRPDEGQVIKQGSAPAGTVIVPELYDEYEAYRSDYPIICIGQNGGWDDAEDLISQQKAILDRYGDGEHYLIVGFCAFTPDDRSELRWTTPEEYPQLLESILAKRDALENAMQEEYGERFLNLRQYMIVHGLEDAGMFPTEEDLADMGEGSVPGSLRSDGVHFNSIGYNLFGRAVYNRMVELGDVS